MKLFIKDMTCGGCARRVTAAIKAVDDKAHIDINVTEKLVDVQGADDMQPILATLAENGYPAEQR